MLHSSRGGTTGAPVHTGRAPRRVPGSFRSSARALLVVALALAAGLALAPAASAHEAPDPEVAAILDRVTPEMPGVTVSVETTRLGSQFVLENPTDTEVTILSSVGDPLFRIGPGGVLGNFRSPEWYTSKVPGGAVIIPERAAERGTPVWARVSEEPAWGWFDHRLHAVSLAPEQKAQTEPLQTFGTWTVPIQYGDALGSLDGHLEYRPALGQFTPELSETEPAPGVTLTALPGNPTPGIAIDNAGASEVVVLGAADEPYLRITPNGTEANALSPTWIASQDPSAVAGSAADPAAPPRWVPVGVTPQYSFTMERAGPDADLAGLYEVTDTTVVREWTVSMLVDGRRIDVEGTTTLTPAGATGGWGFWIWAMVAVAVLVLAGAACWWFVRRGRSGATRPTPPAREKVGTTS